jgi:hypothetical protein
MIGIICACLPACRSLISWMFPKLKITLNGESSRTPQYNNQSFSQQSRSRKRADGSTDNFIELRPSPSSDEDMEFGRAHGIDMNQGLSQFSETTDMPGKGYTCQTIKNVNSPEEEEGELVERTRGHRANRSNSIMMMTMERTVKQNQWGTSHPP